jgi:hypothetical protein
LGKAGLKLKGSKCQFAMTTLKILGHVVSKQGIAPDPEKIAAVRDFPECNQGKTSNCKIKHVQSFLGLCSYYRRHISGFAKIAQPLTALTKKATPFLWGDEQRHSFLTLKKALTSAPILAHPNYESPMIIMSDACGYGIGAVLSQSKDGKEFPLAYASRLLSKAELNYSITEKECLALIWALQKFRCFIWGCKITIVTDHEALCWLRTKKDLAGRLARWSLCLLEYEVEIRYRSGKLHTNADCLSRFPLTTADTNDEDRCVTIGVLNYADNDFFTSEDLADLTAKQQNNHQWRTIITKLENNRSVGRRFCLKNGILFKIKYLKGQAYLRLCVPSEYTHIVLTKCHDDPTAGHLGIHRTLAKIGQRFYWLGLEKEVVSYVKSCKLCQSRKSPKIKPAGLLQCIRVSRPFQNVGIDLLGPFTTSHTGNKMIIVAVEYLTKWVELAPLPSGKADVVSEFLVKHIVLRHGMPEKLISDRGKCFLAGITQTVLRALGIQHKTTSSYHPQSNGQVERMNHTLATMISMYISEDQKDWDAQLNHICFAYNTSRQDSTGFSPFFLLYGREPILPIDLLLGTCPHSLLPESKEVLPYAEQLLLDLQNARHIVRHRMQHVQEKQKKGYDARRCDTTFKKGDLVLIYKPIRKKGRSEKLLHRWIGPCIVLRQTTPVNYEVQLQHSKKKSDIVHVVCMKSFVERIVEPFEYSPATPLLPDTLPPLVQDETEFTRPPSPPPPTNSQLLDVAPETTVSVPEVIPPQLPIPTTGQPMLNNRGNQADLPPRIRRKPNFFMAGLIYLLLLGACSALPTKEGILIRDTVIFKQRPSISISESAWTIVTDVLLHDAENAIMAVEDHLAQLSRVAHAHRMDGNKFEKADVRTAWRDTTSFMAAHKIDNRVLLMGRTLNDSKTRLATCALTLSGARRPKRGILDLGGTTLKWLFGVSTQADLQDLNSRIEALAVSDKTVIHLLDQHASIINETLQLTRSNLALLAELQKQSEILTHRVDYIMDYIKYSELLHVQQTQYFAELDATFATMEHILGWLQRQIGSWEIGLSALANGRLSPQMFSPTTLQTVVADINVNLPLGWTIPSEDLWVIYREARVSVAVINNHFRLFIDIPIYDHAQHFNLFQIISLPKPAGNGSHGVRFTNIPEFLAVTPDLDTFIELSSLEILNCRQLDKQLCAFHTGFSKRGARTSCAVALFTNDVSLTGSSCQSQFIQWNGPEVAYLGQNQWAFSAVTSHSVVFSCPPDSKRPPPQQLQLPPIGYFEVPSGCTARTDHWIFPASLEGSTVSAAIALQIPNLPDFRPNITYNKAATVLPFPATNVSHLSRMSELLLQQEAVDVKASMTHDQIVRLLDSSVPASTHHCAYPYEWVVAFIILTLALGGLTVFTLLLARRMMDHLRRSSGIYEVADYHPVLNIGSTTPDNDN